MKYKLFWSFVERFNLKNSCGAIVGNTEAEKILRAKNFLKPIEVLPQLGVNESYFKPEGHPGLISGSGHFKIGFIGRIVKEKGVFDLVKAFSLIDHKDNWKLIFIGDGKEKENLIKFVKSNNLQNSIDFLPAMPHENIGKYLNQFDIFVLPSYDIPGWKEQFGHVLIEAMACKIAVIGSTGGNITQVVKDSGLIFKQGDVSDLAEKLKTLMFDEKLRNYFAHKGFENFKNNFSYDFITEKTYFFWKKFL
ncbi:glycosyltransferase family 4 protein [Candidatus Dependentiae bacterium]|nr:glycosyltransferase family 4 protein [Candidatus Dependentiae bacterium]